MKRSATCIKVGDIFFRIKAHLSPEFWQVIGIRSSVSNPKKSVWVRRLKTLQVSQTKCRAVQGEYLKTHNPRLFPVHHNTMFAPADSNDCASGYDMKKAGLFLKLDAGCGTSWQRNAHPWSGEHLPCGTTKTMQ